MIIEKINIKSFGPLVDKSFDFSESVNIIEGENEAGKSTVAAFIRYMLYGFSETDSGSEVTERKKRINWTEGTAQGSMYVRVGEKRYIINRTTTPTDNSDRPMYREESSIVDLETGAPVFGKLSAGEVFFGVDSELYNNTAFIGQIGDSGIDEDSVKQSIENILFSATEQLNSERAAAKITDKMDALLHVGGKGGAIVDLIERERELDERLTASNADNSMILAKEAEFFQIRARREAAEEKQSNLYALDSSYNNAMVIQTFDQLHTLEEECDVKNEAYNKFIEDNTHAGYAPDEQYLTDLIVTRKGVNEAYHSLGEAQSAYTAQKNAIGITREIEMAIERADARGGEAEIQRVATLHWKRTLRDLAISIGCGLAALAAGVFEIVAAPMANLDALKIVLWVVMGLALGAAGYFVYDFIKNRKVLATLQAEFSTASYEDLKGKITVIAEARGKRDALALATENARLAVVKARERYENAKKELTALILRWGEEPPSSELGSFLDKLEARVRGFLNKKNELYDEKTNLELTVREIRRNLADKSEIAVRAQVSPLKRKALLSVKHDDIINGIADAKAKIAEEDKLAYEVENELMLLKSRAGDPGEYYSRIDAIATRRQDMQEKHRAYFIALNAIRGASDALRTEISPRLGEYATRMMEIMTDKKYTSFDVSDGLKVNFVDASGNQKSVDFLSGGTRDMAYIAVRAALIDMLYTEKPPICFDESFAHQDNVRAHAMMRAIAELAKEGCQSFIFTCRAREAKLAKEIISDAGVYKLTSVGE